MLIFTLFISVINCSYLYFSLPHMKIEFLKRVFLETPIIKFEKNQRLQKGMFFESMGYNEV